MSLANRSSRATLFASLFIAASTFLFGCADMGTVTQTNPVAVAGNWQIASSATAASKLPALSGAFSGTSSALTGVLHSDAVSSCVAPTTAIVVTGSTDAQGLTTVTGPLAGGILSLTGNVASSGKSLSNAAYTVSGGTCAFASAANATANAFAPISGTYTGTFSDSSGPVTTLNATLTQSPASDPNGNFTLTGTGTFPNNPCFNSPVTVSNTQVTGGNFTLTYADSTTLNSVVVTGTFSQDGTTLTVTNWTLTGSCGPDSGTGSLHN